MSAEALRLLSRTLQAALDVVEAQHQSIAFGGSDAQIQEGSPNAVGTIYDDHPDPAITWRDQPEISGSAGSASAPVRRARGDCGQASGEPS